MPKIKKIMVHVYISLCIIFVIAIMGLLLMGAPRRATVFSMPSDNISELQPNEIMRQIANFAGVTESEIIIPEAPIAQFSIWGDFTLNSATVSLQWETRRNVLANQFRIAPSDEGFFLTSPQQVLSTPPFAHQIEDILYAIKYLPHEHIRRFFDNPPDRYGILYNLNFAALRWVSDHDFPRILYNRSGVVDEFTGDYLRFVLLPSYRCYENPNSWRGDGTVIILYFELELDGM
ncbi:MAG: hypothetical protein FWB88_08830 [Defluviitaleaceae bacterium]|nr:hypothetical protein [Defluviitaleaceae bacterium]MCL2239511.1 hypothetical protein [Defluviitaleaceae bacterium]